MHACLEWQGGRIVIRDLDYADVEAVADYWASADDAFLDALGADRRRLGTREEIKERIRQMVPTGAPDQPRLAFGIERDGRLIGYTNLNLHGAHQGVSHWHLIDPHERGGGLSTALYPHRLATYFGCTEIALLTHQTRTSNLGMNAVLAHYLPVAETRYLAEPDGFAAPGEFNIRRVTREDLPRIFALAEALPR